MNTVQDMKKGTHFADIIEVADFKTEINLDYLDGFRAIIGALKSRELSLIRADECVRRKIREIPGTKLDGPLLALNRGA